MIGQTIENIKAISFDLDDTLYDNWPVIQKAYEDLYHYLVTNHTIIKNNYSFDEFLKNAAQFQEKNKHITDLSLLRQQHIYSLLPTSIDRNQEVDTAFSIFWNARQNVSLYPGTPNVLKKLSSIIPLVSISNGNACIKTMKIDGYFQFSVSPKHLLLPKPNSSMFLFACEKLAIEPHELLHVGDSLTIDIEGAKQAGCRAVWFNPNQSSSSIDVEMMITNLDELLSLDFI